MFQHDSAEQAEKSEDEKAVSYGKFRISLETEEEEMDKCDVAVKGLLRERAQASLKFKRLSQIESEVFDKPPVDKITTSTGAAFWMK